MDKGMKTRWISLYVENQVGVLSKISRLQKPSKPESLTMAKTVCFSNLYRRQPKMTQLSN